MQLLPSLLSGLKVVCTTFPDPRKGRGGNIAPADFGLSAFAMFFMQSASFLAYQRTMEKGHGRSNCQTLFGIGRIPSDNYIRDFLDQADPALLQPCFERMEALLSEPPMRQAFGRLGGRTLIALDGTEFFCSQKLGCPHCLTRKRANGKTESYHSMLSATVVTPRHSKVVPLAPEFIAPQDGAEKQDCERNAVRRWFAKHGARLAPLRPVFLGDDLFACHPVAKMVTDAGDDFIFTCKPTSHKTLYDFIDGAEFCRHEEKVRRRNTAGRCRECASDAQGGAAADRCAEGAARHRRSEPRADERSARPGSNQSFLHDRHGRSGRARRQPLGCGRRIRHNRNQSLHVCPGRQLGHRQLQGEPARRYAPRSAGDDRNRRLSGT